MSLTDFKIFYDKLNPQQRLAVDTVEGAVLVVAGPGSGKTQILSMRVANILRQTDSLASNILCLTFTDAASVNMKERLRAIIGPEAHKVAVHTFHSFATEILNQYSEFFFQGVEYQPADTITKLSVLQKVLEQLPLTNPLNSYSLDHGWTFLGSIQGRISELKKAGLTPEEYKILLEDNQVFIESVDAEISEFFSKYQNTQKAVPFVDELVAILNKNLDKTEKYRGQFLSLKTIICQSLNQAIDEMEELEKTKKSKPLTTWKNKYFKMDGKKKLHLKDTLNQKKYFALADVYQQYNQKMHQEKLFDFDDMILQVVQALKKYPELRYNLQERYLYFLVDEYQDTSGVQSDLISLLVDTDFTNNPNIMAVGDDDQSVYKFQGASLANIMHFTKKYPKAVIITMTKNYRSLQPILDYAMLVTDQIEERLTQIPGVVKNLESQVRD